MRLPASEMKTILVRLVAKRVRKRRESERRREEIRAVLKAAGRLNLIWRLTAMTVTTEEVAIRATARLTPR